MIRIWQRGLEDKTQLLLFSEYDDPERGNNDVAIQQSKTKCIRRGIIRMWWVGEWVCRDTERKVFALKVLLKKLGATWMMMAACMHKWEHGYSLISIAVSADVSL
jgi:hypothetical protein